jgi:hypothetical protein
MRADGVGDVARCKRRARVPRRQSASALCSRGVYGSVTNLDAGPIPNAPIPVPNGGASGPIITPIRASSLPTS